MASGMGLPAKARCKTSSILRPCLRSVEAGADDAEVLGISERAEAAGDLPSNLGHALCSSPTFLVNGTAGSLIHKSADWLTYLFIAFSMRFR